MRRVATLLLFAVGLPALLVFGLGAGKSQSGYEVRAIFDNAAYIVKGEDVKVAGAVVGEVKGLDVTPGKRAVIVLNITKPGFSPFHVGACRTTRQRSWTGEKCVASKPGPGGGRDPPQIKRGDGKAKHPLTTSRSRADRDRVNDPLRLPYRQRLALLINEF